MRMLVNSISGPLATCPRPASISRWVRKKELVAARRERAEMTKKTIPTWVRERKGERRGGWGDETEG